MTAPRGLLYPLGGFVLPVGGSVSLASDRVAPSPTAPAVASLRADCVAWYAGAQRDLPWRQTRDPYSIWVSEIMLQQTRVDVVAPRYRRFMRRFPDVEALARAPLEDVVQEWAGLGYYARARNLHAAAGIVQREFAGQVPREALASLPGIGRYTAGAIRSIAWQDPEPILDGNVARVFARLFGVDGESATIRKQQWELATWWAHGADPGTANQALMELGATVCTKQRPECERCPVAHACFARRHGHVAALPAPRKRPATRKLALAVFLIEHRERLLLVRRQDGRLLRDLWELPSLAGRTSAILLRRASERLGSTFTAHRALGSVRHAILEHAIEAQVLATTAMDRGQPTARHTPIQRRAPIANLGQTNLEFRWVTKAECQRLPLATLAHKSLTHAASRETHWLRFVPNEE